MSDKIVEQFEGVEGFSIVRPFSVCSRRVVNGYRPISLGSRCNLSKALTPRRDLASEDKAIFLHRRLLLACQRCLAPRRPPHALYAPATQQQRRRTCEPGSFLCPGLWSGRSKRSVCTTKRAVLRKRNCRVGARARRYRSGVFQETVPRTQWLLEPGSLNRERAPSHSLGSFRETVPRGSVAVGTGIIKP